MSTKAHKTILYEYKKQNCQERELLNLFIYFPQYTILTGDQSSKEIIINISRKVKELTSSSKKERKHFEMVVEALIQHGVLSKNKIGFTLRNRAVKGNVSERSVTVMLDILHEMQYSKLNLYEHISISQLESVEIPSLYHYSSGLAGLLDLYTTVFQLTGDKD